MPNFIMSSFHRLGKLGSTFQRLIFNLTENEVRLVEFQNSTLLIMWGFFIGVVPVSHLYGAGELLASIGHAPLLWAAFCFLLGAAQALTGFHQILCGRIITAFVSALLWGFLTVLTPITEPGKWVVPTYVVLCLTQAVVYLRLSLSAVAAGKPKREAS